MHHFFTPLKKIIVNYFVLSKVSQTFSTISSGTQFHSLMDLQKDFLNAQSNSFLVFISFYPLHCTLNISPLFPFFSSEVLSPSQLHSQLQIQKLNVFRYCKSLFKRRETAVICVYSQCSNLSLLEIRWCSGGIFQAEKTSWHILFKIQTQQVAYSALSAVAAFQIRVLFNTNMPSIVSQSSQKSQH